MLLISRYFYNSKYLYERSIKMISTFNRNFNKNTLNIVMSTDAKFHTKIFTKRI